MSSISNRHPPHELCESYRWLAVFLAPIITGVLAPLCFPPYKIWPLAFIVLIPFAGALRVRDQSVWLYTGAFIGGFLFLGIGLQFIERISSYENNIYGLYLFRLWVLATLLGMWVWPLAAWLTRFFFFKLHVPFVISFVTGWIFAEQSRHWLMLVLTDTECPWMHFGYTLSRQNELLQLASIGGTTLVSSVILLINAALADLFFALDRDRRYALIRLVCVAGLLSCQSLCAKWQLSMKRISGPRIAIVTGSIGSRDASEVIQSIESEKKGIAADYESVEFFVWPELAMHELTISNQSMHPSDEVTLLLIRNIEELAARLRSHLFVGFSRRSSEAPSATRWNSVLYVSPISGANAFSDKHILVPFAERTPTWGRLNLIQNLLTTPYRGRTEFTSTQEFHSFEVNDIPPFKPLRIAPCICYDCSSPSFVGKVAFPANFILHIGSEPRDPEMTVAQSQLDMAILRAVETGRPIVRCTRDGYSGVIDCFGRIVFIEKNPFNPVPIVFANVPLENRKTIYSQLGDWPPVALGLLCLTFALVNLVCNADSGLICRRLNRHNDLSSV